MRKLWLALRLRKLWRRSKKVSEAEQRAAVDKLNAQMEAEALALSVMPLVPRARLREAKIVNYIQKRKNSWKTTAGGVGSLFAGLAMIARGFAGDTPLSMEEWAAAVGLITGGLGMLFARDNDVSSEQAGAK